MGLRLIEGRDFSETSGTEAERPVIVNETFVREIGWDEPIGKQIGRLGGQFSGRVIGVVEDYHFHSLQERIAPFAIFRGDADYSGANAPQRARSSAPNGGQPMAVRCSSAQAASVRRYGSSGSRPSPSRASA